MRHIIAILLQNEAGALTRVAGLFSTRGYNIESLSVATTDDPTVSRLTLVTSGSDPVIQQIVNQLNKLVDVVNVLDMTRGEHLERELVLLKLRVPAGETDAVRGQVVRSGGRVLDPANEGFIVELTASEAEVNGFVAELAR
ncbi:MAG TPA: acetolactate synthase small subunit, partial [Steroidobacteraceae bacterium]|nr:acetolactate synthase small subunit [Steroidobacteraceae bacterium]